MAKRYTAKTKSETRRRRLSETKFLQKYNYTSDDDLMFEKFRSKRLRQGSDLEEYAEDYEIDYYGHYPDYEEDL